MVASRRRAAPKEPELDNAAERKRKREIFMGPSQRQSLHKSIDPGHRPLPVLLGLVVATFAVCAAAILLCSDTKLAELPGLFVDVATFTRVPWTAQDNVAATAATAIGVLPLLAFDVLIGARLNMPSGARWFLLHSLGNFFVGFLSVPDFYYGYKAPKMLISVPYCRTLPFPGCSDWPTIFIMSMHWYHCIAFKLSADDLFHHVLFVPLIAGLNFAYPWGVGGNILCFFISGIPGGVDYMLLAMVKTGRLASYTEKRINCSINTWVRSPGIIMFCTLVTACWLDPVEGTPPSDLMPWYILTIVIVVIFFNAQYYAQRVIGSYYIRKAQEYSQRGLLKVDLHSS